MRLYVSYWGRSVSEGEAPFWQGVSFLTLFMPPAARFLFAAKKKPGKEKPLKGTYSEAVPLRIPPRRPRRGLRAPPLDPPRESPGRGTALRIFLLNTDTIEYVKAMAAETGIAYQTLIDFYLTDCADKRRKLTFTPALPT